MLEEIEYMIWYFFHREENEDERDYLASEGGTAGPVFDLPQEA